MKRWIVLLVMLLPVLAAGEDRLSGVWQTGKGLELAPGVRLCLRIGEWKGHEGEYFITEYNLKYKEAYPVGNAKIQGDELQLLDQPVRLKFALSEDGDKLTLRGDTILKSKPLVLERADEKAFHEKLGAIKASELRVNARSLLLAVKRNAIPYMGDDPFSDAEIDWVKVEKDDIPPSGEDTPEEQEAEAVQMDQMVGYYLNVCRYSLDKEKWSVERLGNKIMIEAKFEVNWNQMYNPVLTKEEKKPNKLKYRIELEFLPEMSDTEYKKLVLEHAQREVDFSIAREKRAEDIALLHKRRHEFIEKHPLPKYLAGRRTPVVLRTNAKHYMGFMDDANYREVLYVLDCMSMGMGMAEFLP